MQGFDPAVADPALTIEYPQKPVAANDQKVGYLVITVHEDTGTYDGVEKEYNVSTRSWETGDTFSLKAR
jgi:hypothetical protein